MTQKTVIVPRGLPASGKSTWVQEQVKGSVFGSAVRINNDDLSTMLFGSPWPGEVSRRGALLAQAREGLLRTYLADEDILDIYVDNTNLVTKTVRGLERIAHEHGADFIVYDGFLNVDVEECIRRDAARDRTVGEKVIRDMNKLAERLGPWEPSESPIITPYHNDPSLPWCIIMDIDGTTAIKYEHRGIYDGTLAHLDTPNTSVIEAIRALRSRDYIKVIAMSGRGDNDREVTERWIERNVGYGIPLFMRKAGDTRPDWIVKHELFQEHIADQYHVLCSFDDRDQVIHLWRRRLGLPTFQVADGKF